jgi:GT2 family glycosyltransferase
VNQDLARRAIHVSVIVPTYRRPDSLRLCLRGLKGQSRAADEIIVVRRPEDEGAKLVLAELGESLCKETLVFQPGVLAAMRTGLTIAVGGIVAFVDDDAVPRPDWIARLVGHFRDPQVGAVGGRDFVRNVKGTEEPACIDVGRITRWGKLIGNHHLGEGPPRNVMVLKGVNMAFRREAIMLPTHLRGNGAQPHFEVALCLLARRSGWRLVYDPATAVDHFPGPRFDGDQRGHPDRRASCDAAYNLVFGIVGTEPSLYWRRAAYGVLVGDRAVPGFVRTLVAAAARDGDIVKRLGPSLRGQIAALLDVARGRRPMAL